MASLTQEERESIQRISDLGLLFYGRMMIDDGRSGGDDEDDLYMIIHPLSLQRGPLEAPTAPVACAPSPGPMAVGGMGRYGP